MQIINGRTMRDEILASLEERVKALPFKPVFCDVLVGDNEVSEQYVRMKEHTAELLGLATHHAAFPATISEAELVAEIAKIAAIPHMAGIIIQLPLPAHMHTQTILDAVPSHLDVDALNTMTSHHFYSNTPGFVFPTALAVLAILDSLKLDLSTKKIVVVGQGMLVGKPVTHMLESRGLQVTTVDAMTHDAESIFATADVLISAVGKDGLITGKHLKQGVVLVDAGTSEAFGGIVGDVDRASVEGIASALSPVPGGVGPVTVAMLMQNVVTGAEAAVVK